MAEFNAYTSFNLELVYFGALFQPNRFTTDFARLQLSYNGIDYDRGLRISYDFQGAQSMVLGGTGIDFNRTLTSPQYLFVSGTTINVLLGFADAFNGGNTPTFDLTASIPVSLFNDVVSGATPGDSVAFFTEVFKGADIIRLSDEIDSISGFAGNDRIEGNGGDDTLYGGSGNDRILGGAGDDYIIGEAGKDVIYGGTGNDTASYRLSSVGVRVDLGLTVDQDTVGAGIDRLASIENLDGTDFADRLTGNALANVLTGGSGSDRLIGLGGNDTLNGGLGTNYLDGGAGIDTVTYKDSLARVTVSLAIAGAQVVGGKATDTLLGIENVSGSRFDDTISGNAGANTLSGGVGADRLYGGDGNDRIYGLQAGSNGADGDNKLYGQNGDDLLVGAGGLDYLAGGLGNDRLIGGANSDLLIGGGGADVFVLAFDYAVDQITDFSSAQGDKIELSVIGSDFGPGFVLTPGPGGALTDAEFYAAAGATEAHDASDRIIYNTTTGDLFYDADGTGTDSIARQFGIMASASIFDPMIPVLAASDFVIDI